MTGIDPTSGQATHDPTSGHEPTTVAVAHVGEGAAPSGEVEPRRRLHPLSPVLRGANLAAIAIAAISWQGLQDLGTLRWLYAVSGVVVLVLAASLVSWLVTGYHVVGRELRIYEGLLWRRTRAIPLERLQSVEIVRPLLARLSGLAELRLEVVGASKTEAPLAFLRVEDAAALRERLLLLARGAPLRVPGPAAPEASTTDIAGTRRPFPATGLAPPRPVHVVANRDLVVSQLLRPQWWALPLAIAAPIFFLAYESNFGIVAIASTITAVIGAIQAPVRVLLGDWQFTIGAGPDGLRLHRGLIETRSQTVPAGRVQAVGVHWPLLWRSIGWVRANLEIAGVPTGQGRGVVTGTLLPVGTVPTAERVIGEALPGFVLTTVVVTAPPRRARCVVPLRAGVLGCQLTDSAFVSRDGLLTRTLTIVPYRRIQSIRIRQGPWQRLLRLASVYADTAGGLQAMALHRDRTEARQLAIELTDRCRAARHATPGRDASAGRDASGRNATRPA